MANEFKINADGITVEAGSGFVAASFVAGQQMKIALESTETGGESIVINKNFIITVLALSNFDDDFDEDFR